jgi:hypothetical protein
MSTCQCHGASSAVRERSQAGTGRLPYHGKERDVIREDQAEYLLNLIEKDYKSFMTSDRKRWLTADDRTNDDRTKLREELGTSLHRAQAAITTIDTQAGVSPELRQLRGKLVIAATMAEADLKQQAPR